MRKTYKQITVPLQKDIRELLKRRKEAALKKRIENIRESYVFDYIRLLPEQAESQRLANASSIPKRNTPWQINARGCLEIISNNSEFYSFTQRTV